MTTHTVIYENNKTVGIYIFYPTLESHPSHLKAVVTRLKELLNKR